MEDVFRRILTSERRQKVETKLVERQQKYEYRMKHSCSVTAALKSERFAVAVSNSDILKQTRCGHLCVLKLSTFIGLPS